jgi:hypothetical protein
MGAGSEWLGKAIPRPFNGTVDLLRDEEEAGEAQSLERRHYSQWFCKITGFFFIQSVMQGAI